MFKCSQHISHAADKFAKLILSLSKSAKIHWRLKLEDLITIKKIYPNALNIRCTRFDRPNEVWIKQTQIYTGAKSHEHNIAKSYHTTTSEALCILAGSTPIIIEDEEAAKRYEVWNRHRANIRKIAWDVGLNKWPHLA